MDRGEEVDPVLRSLGADLERDDPRLAALLRGEQPRRRRSGRVWLLALPLLSGLLLLPLTTAVGVVVLLLVVVAPLVAILGGHGSEEGLVPGPG